MKLRNTVCKDSVKQIVGYIKNNNIDEAIKKISYLTGLYGCFYGVAILYELSEKDQIAFLTALQDVCDPER